ncbi:hypothetical protein FOMPIDRAFT_91417 [Fomitopsis schrenkii]|uniref:Uncharacterized protein n=1 Tax=Fomitopsis schrenkii TaxID=2126942 RepID=S8FA46_FOMSC|nr:hypothetical protein FOMPIDRAFT_91417 [Fomitopsis schrenkii]
MSSAVLLRSSVDATDLAQASAAKVAAITGGTLDIRNHHAAKSKGPSGRIGACSSSIDGLNDGLLIGAFKVHTLGAVRSVDSFLHPLPKGAAKRIVTVTFGGGVRGVVWKSRFYGELRAKSAENPVMAKYAAPLEDDDRRRYLPRHRQRDWDAALHGECSLPIFL